MSGDSAVTVRTPVHCLRSTRTRALRIQVDVRYALRRAFVAVMMMMGFLVPAFAGDINCFIGVNNTTVLVDTAFDLITKPNIPASVSKTAVIAASCNPTWSLFPTTYQWRLTVKALRFTMVTGTTPKAVLDGVVKSFGLSRTTLVVNAFDAQMTLSAAATLSGLTTQLSAGKYMLSQDIEVQRQSCTWILIISICGNDGGLENFTANYTLNVAAPTPVQPPGGNSPPPVVTPPTSGGSTPATKKKVTPNLWTVAGGVRKFRCNC